MKFLGYLTAFILSAVICTTFSGYTLSVLWGWFIVDTFNTVSLSVPVAIGISTIFKFIENHREPTKEETTTFGGTLAREVGVSLGRSLMALLFGWVALQWI